MGSKAARRNILFVALMFIFCSSCEIDQKKSKHETPSEHRTELKINQLQDEDFEVIEFEGCEYLIYKHHSASNIGYGFMAHKGNCKNPIHLHNQKLKVCQESNTKKVTQ